MKFSGANIFNYFILIQIFFFLPSCNKGQVSEVSFSGKKVIVTGGNAHSTIADNDILTLKVDSHNIILDEEQITVNGVSERLPDFQVIHIMVKGGEIEIELDGIPFQSEMAPPATDKKADVSTFSAKKGGAPKGFVRADTQGASGDVWHQEVGNASSSTAQLEEALKRLSDYFGAPVVSVEGFRDREDKQAQVTFHSRMNGHAVSGVIVSLVSGKKGVVSIATDKSEVLPQSIDALMGSLEKTIPLPAREKKRPPSNMQWHTAYFPDGSGRIRIPRGWRITSSYQGGADIAGTEGEYMSVGVGVPVATHEATVNPYTGTPMQGALAGYPNDPVKALGDILSQTGFTGFKAVEYTPVQSPTGGRAAYILYDVNMRGVPYRAFSLIDCSPIAAGWWTFYYTTVSAPSREFSAKLPIMMEAWKGWEVNPQVFQQRLNKALQSMRETNRLINEAYSYRQQSFDNSLADWTEVFRGSRMVRDTRTGEEMPTDIGWVNETVDRLNEREGYERYEQIPLRQWNNQ